MIAALFATALPVLLAFNVPPSSTFLNQAAALAGWGVFVAVLAAGGATARDSGRSFLSLGAVLVVLALAALGAAVRTHLPSGLALSSTGIAAAAVLTVLVASRIDFAANAGVGFRAFAIALQVAALASVAIAAVQYFFPNLPDGDVIARAAAIGRVGANLRQANHLSSLLLAALAAAVWLREAALARGEADTALRRIVFATVLLGMVFGVVLTVSRTGIVCIVILVFWGIIDRRMSRLSRVMLWVLPVALGLMWAGVEVWANAHAQAFAGESQLHKGDLSSSRFGIWSNTLALIGRHPWTGVGWGDFNFAWTLTPFPGRPIAFFDHTHNLPLHFAVEMGLPLAALVMGLLLLSLGLAIRKAVVSIEEDLPAVRCSLVMVLMMGVHSMLEYPLWYAYFLLPTAFAFGVALSGREKKGDHPKPSRMKPFLLACSGLLVAGALWSVVDYWKVVQIFAPGDDAAPLEQRIAVGRTSVLFRHHAEYAAVTTAPKPSTEMAGFAIATHYLLDARLMIAWAKALAESGEVEKARYVAQRLKEFRHPLGDEFFAACDKQDVEPKPFQCTPPTRSFTFKDFR